MIDTNPLRRWLRSSGRRRRAARRPGLAGEEGITLIEVMISALMVGFIAIATFNGFDAANRATTAERLQNQATLLAAESQESLRSDSATTLDRIEESSHVFKQTVGGETYTIIESDKWVADNNQNASCSASGEEHSAQAGNYLQIHTEVTWPQQLASGAHALEQYSIITPPDGSGLEVYVLNGLTPKEPVAGVTVIAGEGPTASTATTGEAGCVIFGGIPATRIPVEAFKIGDVTQTGAIKKVFPEELVAPNVTTHVPVTLNQGAAITAEFAYKGEKTHEGKTVTGDTFAAYNAGLESAPHLELGSTSFNATYGSEGQYEALTSKYEATATTPKSGTYYPSGDLFPYEKAWEVYAGDCEANNPSTVTKGEVAEGTVSLTPGQDATVEVPTSLVTLDVYKNVKSKTNEPETTSHAVKITNEACKGSPTPNNASAFSYVHTQNTTTTGHLEAPFQPFGKPFKLCLYDKEKQKTYTTTYANETTVGPILEIFIEEPEGKYTDIQGHTIEVKKGQISNTC
jgi:type II secretory pathway pseudopilin PulG